MKPRNIIRILIIILVVVVGVNYIRLSLEKASAPPQLGKAPSLDDAPVRVYGLIEPLGREVFIGPLQPKRVIEVAVEEGDTVKVNDVLIRLDDDLEKQSLLIAESRLEEAVKSLHLIQDDLARKRELVLAKAIPKFELSQIELQSKLQEQYITTSRTEIQLRNTELAKLTLRSPIAGIVYKMDVRVGEQLTPQDYARIVIGKHERQVRMFIETFWLNRVQIGQRFIVKEAETLLDVGTGTIISMSPYVGARDFRTEDKLERLDTKYGQAILRLDSNITTPIGMQVMCEKIETK
ncbi:possible ABC transporter component [Candidatus Vecturithrix granuli]|uniref:Possible ABC transporter component n=1 Tax=Vecturithrix granuli TaxID=1499967 RepID=A0A0S6WAP2_VECG1|nr:possible ABC transporter component [Candidatus Vecturithrix granuli]